MSCKCAKCDIKGCRINLLYNKRVCSKCIITDEYLLINKINACEKYILENNDFLNYEYEIINLENVPLKNKKNFLNEQTLYYEKDIIKLFNKKYYNILIKYKNINNLLEQINLVRENLNNLIDVNIINEEILNNTDENIVNNTDEEILNNTDENIVNNTDKEILNNTDYIIEDIKNYLLQNDIKDLQNIDSITESIKSVININIKKNKLTIALKENNLMEYINLDICKEYINNNLYELDNIILYLNYIVKTKYEIKQIIDKYNLSNSTFLYLFDDYIIQLETVYDENIINDTEKLNDLLNIIIKKEVQLKKINNELLKYNCKFELPHKIFKKYIDGNDFYTQNYIIQLINETKWFITNTKYLENLKVFNNLNFKFDKQSNIILNNILNITNMLFDDNEIKKYKSQIKNRFDIHNDNNVLNTQINILLNCKKSIDYVKLIIVKYYSLIEYLCFNGLNDIPILIVNNYEETITIFNFKYNVFKTALLFNLVNNSFEQHFNNNRGNYNKNMLIDFENSENSDNEDYNCNISCINKRCINTKAKYCTFNMCKICCTLNKSNEKDKKIICYGHNKKKNK